MAGEEQQKHFYQEIRKNADRLLALINDIIRLSELDRKGYESTFEEVDLYEIAKECLDELLVNAKGRSVTISVEGESCNVRGSRDLLKELIENLSQNAIRYNNLGGKVLISISQKIAGQCLR